MTNVARALVTASLLMLLASCKTIGVSTVAGGFAEVSPQIASEMILDSRQVIVFDIRPNDVFRREPGHIAGAINAPFETIEKQLPELLPYQNDTVLVYGDSSTDGSLGARLLSLAGFRNIVHIDGGLEQWIELGYRTVHSQ